MSREKLTLEEAENIVDNMYQNRWKECGVEEGNTIHMGNLEILHYSELERASILLLRTEIRLKRENQELKKQLEAKNIQQKEFIEWLESEIERIPTLTTFFYNREGHYVSETEVMLKEVNKVYKKYREIFR